MFKENGRKTPPTNKDYASKTKVAMKCIRCGSVEYVSNVQFGEQYRCKECKGVMYDRSFLEKYDAKAD